MCLAGGACHSPCGKSMRLESPHPRAEAAPDGCGRMCPRSRWSAQAVQMLLLSLLAKARALQLKAMTRAYHLAA